jgi:hypothetical protein
MAMYAWVYRVFKWYRYASQVNTLRHLDAEFGRCAAIGGDNEGYCPTATDSQQNELMAAIIALAEAGVE